MLQRYQEIADERYAARLAEYEKRLKKAQEDGIMPVEEPKEPKKAKKVTKDKKSTTAKKKKSASSKSKKTTAKKTSGTKKSTTSSKKAKSAKLDEDADQWITSDDED